MARRLLNLYAAFSAALILAVLLHCPKLCADQRPLVKIGLIYPLSGPMSSFGEDMAKAIPLLEKRFNSSQSKYRFKIIPEDGQFGHSNASITAAKKLVEADGVRFLAVGSSGEILQIAPFVESSQVLAVAGFASHPDVKKAGDFIFRTYIDAGRGIDLVAADLHSKGYKRLAVISEESSFTLAIKNCLEETLGPMIIAQEDFALAEGDYRSLIARVKSRNPDIYYLNTATPASFIALFRQLKDNGVKEPLYVYYTPSLKDVQDSLGAALNGTLYLDYPETAESEDFKEFLKEFEKMTGAPPRAPFNFRTNYNAVKVIFDGIMQAGPDAPKVKDYLYTYNRPGAAGVLSFDGNGDAADLNLVLKTYGSR